MWKDAADGFCMALADSVPGVSGGTVAFIMGFYDRFIGSIERMAFGTWKEKREALRYLIRLGAGWIVGMGMAVVVLSALFESHIYTVSSLFIGFVAGAIPLILWEERKSVRKAGSGIVYGILGAALVAAITWGNAQGGMAALSLDAFSVGLGMRMFLIGMAAISAMFLPGISGSTLLLIFGAYMPVISAVREVLSLNFSCIPALLFFGCGIITGAVTVVRVIRMALEKFRPQAVYAILGMMIGSFYAIVMGPTTLPAAQEALGVSTFQPIACLAGAGLVLGMQVLRQKGERHGN
ncbi:MAG: DUF368 domain-containing protein [Eubacteriales bacterium]|nr:DUF368 domain-containing protein [Eubacteriales bacterium]